MATVWSVPREWDGETCAILASGPSMTRASADLVQGRCRVIAVSNQGIPNRLRGTMVPAFAPWADVLYAADEQWWRVHSQHALSFPGRKVVIGSTPCGQSRVLRDCADVLMLQNGGRQGFDERPTHLRTGGNSGYQAVHLAAHFGAKRILLLGFDMRGTHWFGNHPKPLGQCNSYGRWINCFTALAPELKRRGIEVINCTPGSALKCFPFAKIDDVLTGESGRRAA